MHGHRHKETVGLPCLLAEDHKPDVGAYKRAVEGKAGDAEQETAATRPVAMKFMTDSQQFEREVSFRKDCKLEPEHVLDKLIAYDGSLATDQGKAFATAITQHLPSALRDAGKNARAYR